MIDLIIKVINKIYYYVKQITVLLKYWIIIQCHYVIPKIIFFLTQKYYIINLINKIYWCKRREQY